MITVQGEALCALHMQKNQSHKHPLTPPEPAQCDFELLSEEILAMTAKGKHGQGEEPSVLGLCALHGSRPGWKVYISNLAMWTGTLPGN